MLKMADNNFLRQVEESVFYRGADKSLARPTSRYILFDSENISFDASLVMYVNSTNIPPFMFINRIYEHQNLLSL
jgi:homoserine trans-succinylase